MEPKKNIKSDVSRNASLYFAVGLALMMGLTYLTMNYRSYDDRNLDREYSILNQFKMRENFSVSDSLEIRIITYSGFTPWRLDLKYS